MTDRPDGCYRWVIFDPDCEPEIAYWADGAWHLRGDIDETFVHKVGVGGTLDAPPDVWGDDGPTYGTDDPDAGILPVEAVREAVRVLSPKIVDYIAANNALLTAMRKRGP